MYLFVVCASRFPGEDVVALGGNAHSRPTNGNDGEGSSRQNGGDGSSHFAERIALEIITRWLTVSVGCC